MTPVVGAKRKKKKKKKVSTLVELEAYIVEKVGHYMPELNMAKMAQSRNTNHVILKILV